MQLKYTTRQMQRNNFQTTDAEHKRKWIDYCSLFVVMHYIGYRFIQSTMFPFVFSDLYKYCTIASLLVFGCFRLLYYIIHTENRKTDITQLIFFAFFSLPFLYVGLKNNYKFLVFLPVSAICLYKISPEKVLRWFAYLVVFLVLSTILCCLTGVIPNLSYITNQKVIGAYGFINTTDFASYSVFLVLFAWCSQKKKTLLVSIITGIITTLIGCFIYCLTNSKTALLCNILTVLFIIWDCLEDNTLFKKIRTSYICKKIDYLTIIVFPVLCILFIMLLLLFSKQNTFAIQVNKILSDRLNLTFNIAHKYGIYPFGAQIDVMHGNGGTLIHTWSFSDYIDVGYAMLAIRYGWIVLLDFSIVWILVTYKALKCGKKRIAFSMVIIAIHALSEARFLDINYNILLTMPLCAFVSETEEESDTYSIDNLRRHICWKTIMPSIMLAIILCLTIKKAISWLKTIFQIYGWQSGNHTLLALCTCLFIFLIVFFLWKSIYSYLKNHERKNLLVTLASSFFLCSIIILGNITINNELPKYTQQIENEKEYIQLIQKSATQPVYIDYYPEIYQNIIGGFDELSFTPNDMYSKYKGTIITNKNNEIAGIIRTGGKYLQLSEQICVYSYDNAVISALEKAGYNMSIYYSSERQCDLKELAKKNDLQQDENGNLIIIGEQKSITKNNEHDQFFGTYEVRYDIRLLSDTKEPDDIVCTIRVMGEANEQIINEQQIKYLDFDEKGECTKSIIYNIKSTPKVSYQLLGEKNVVLSVQRITWKQLPYDNKHFTEMYPIETAYDLPAHAIEINRTNLVIKNADIVDDQYNNQPGILCKGTLKRSYEPNEISVCDYLRDINYNGFQYEIDDIGPITFISFYGKKIQNHGQPIVYIYNTDGILISKSELNYASIDNRWHQYLIDVSNLSGKVFIIFHGGYIDISGNPDSQYVFSDIKIY